jgi:hypothetical protein
MFLTPGEFADLAAARAVLIRALPGLHIGGPIRLFMFLAAIGRIAAPTLGIDEPSATREVLAAEVDRC